MAPAAPPTPRRLQVLHVVPPTPGAAAGPPLHPVNSEKKPIDELKKKKKSRKAPSICACLSGGARGRPGSGAGG